MTILHIFEWWGIIDLLILELLIESRGPGTGP